MRRSRRRRRVLVREGGEEYGGAKGEYKLPSCEEGAKKINRGVLVGRVLLKCFLRQSGLVIVLY